MGAVHLDFVFLLVAVAGPGEVRPDCGRVASRGTGWIGAGRGKAREGFTYAPRRRGGCYGRALSFGMARRIPLLVLLCVLHLRAAAQCPEGLEAFLTGFDTLAADQFSFLDDQLDSVSIVGYGEDTHGSAEFTVLARELLAYLVTRHGFTGVVLETMVGEGAMLDAYVQGERDDLDRLLFEVNSSWRYRTDEFVALLEWMRGYNATATKPIHLYGSEMQFVKADAQLVREYLTEVGHAVEFGAFSKHIWQDFGREERTAAFEDYQRLLSAFTDGEDEMIAATSSERYARMRHHVEVIGQFALVVNQPRERYKHDLRDLYMAQNVLQPFKAGEKDTRLLYWAHNAHIGDWVSNGQVDVAGHQLKKRMGQYYYGLATDFGNGEFRALAERGTMWSWQTIDFTLDPGTFTACLARTGHPYAFLDLRAARRQPALDSRLRAPLPVMGGAGAQYYGSPTTEEAVGRAFDGIIYLDRVHPITRRDRPE